MILKFLISKKGLKLHVWVERKGKYEFRYNFLICLDAFLNF